VTVFGYLKYDPTLDTFEFIDPFAIFLGGRGDLATELKLDA
jgi:hypothetical protein